MSRPPQTSILLLSAALLIGAGPYLVRAVGQQPDRGTVAIVDMRRLFLESDARQANARRVIELDRTLSQRFDQIRQMTYLTGEEIGELNALLNVEKPTEEQKNRIAAIQTEAGKRAEEYARLSTTKDSDLTAQDKMRLRQLNGMAEQHRLAMAQLQQLYQRMVSDEGERQTRQTQAEIRAVVGKLAREMGYTQVFDVEALVYAPVDLTEKALDRVKKRQR